MCNGDISSASTVTSTICFITTMHMSKNHKYNIRKKENIGRGRWVWGGVVEVGPK